MTTFHHDFENALYCIIFLQIDSQTKEHKNLLGKLDEANKHLELTNKQVLSHAQFDGFIVLWREKRKCHTNEYYSIDLNGAMSGLLSFLSLCKLERWIFSMS